MQDVYSVKVKLTYGHLKVMTITLICEEGEGLRIQAVSLENGVKKIAVPEKDKFDFMMKYLYKMMMMMMPTALHLQVGVEAEDETDDEFFDMEYTLADLIHMRKTHEKICDAETEDTVLEGDAFESHWGWDNDDFYNWTLDHIIRPHIVNLNCSYKNTKKLELVKGLTCPVLMEPLDADALLLTKCNHWISESAWLKIFQMGGHKNVPCPMCRCEYSFSAEWTGDTDKILKALEAKPVSKPEGIPMD